MQTATKQCPRCSAVVPLGALGCHCGHGFRTVFADSQTHLAQAQTLPPPVNLACRRCGYEDTQKVSGVVTGGAWTSASNSTGVTGGHVFGGPNYMAVTSSHSRSSGAMILAQALAAPQQPYMKSPTKRTTGLLMVFLGGSIFTGCAIALLNGEKDAAPILIFLIVLCAITTIVGIALLMGARSEEFAIKMDNNSRHQRWQQAVATWDRLFYCSRCDTVFDPLTNASTAAMNMYSLL